MILNDGDVLKHIQNLITGKQPDEDTKTNPNERYPINATTSDDLPDEFHDNPETISRTFPHMFPFGVTKTNIGGTAAIKGRVMEQLLKFYDNRFSTNPEFIFQMSDILKRHQVASKLSRRFKGNDTMAIKLQELLNTDDFDLRLKAAIKNPSTRLSQQLFNKLTVLTRV